MTVNPGRSKLSRRALLGSGLFVAANAPEAFSQTVAGGVPSVSRRAPPGLQPNSDQDQTRSLERALASAAKERRAVHLPAGRYRIGNLPLNPGTRLIGAGAGATILAQAGDQPLIVARGGEGITLQNLTLEGNPGAHRTTPLASLMDIRGLDVTGVALTGTRGAALRLERCGGRIERNSIAEADIGIFSLDATGLQIVGNVIDRCANNGIQVWRSQKGFDGTQVLANRVSNIAAQAGGSGQNGNGINVFRAGNVMISQNVIRDCDFTAIRNNGGDNVQILGNSCTGLAEVAIYAEFAFEGCIVANNMVDRSSVGVSITNFNENGRLAVVTGNLIRNLVRRRDPDRGTLHGGTGIAVEADTTVVGNVIEGAEFAGVSVGYGVYQRNVVCSSNVVRRCAYGVTVSVVPNSGSAQITNNILSECVRGRIVGFHFDEAASGDLAEVTDRRFAHLTIHGNT